jgi:hypothetical protein
MPQHVLDAIDKAAEKGAKRLDQRKPGWFRKIDQKKLDLGSTCYCVLGQLYGEYNEESIATVVGGWVRKLTGSRSSVYSVAERYGFTVPSEADDWVEDDPNWQESKRSTVVWNRLERAWKLQIKERLAEAA